MKYLIFKKISYRKQYEQKQQQNIIFSHPQVQTFQAS